MIAAYEKKKPQGTLLDGNEAPENLPQWLLDEILEEFKHIDFNRYPDDDYRELRQSAAKVYGVNEEQIICGSGSDQMLQMVISRFARPGGTLSTLSPDFGMYDFYGSLFFMNLDKSALDFDSGIDLDLWIEHLKKVKPDLVLFSNPNNPTGHILSPDEVRKLASALPQTPICIDEAYIEFSGDSALPLLDEFENLYITRTLSKAYNLAGCRVGFLLSTKENIDKIKPYKIVYNLSTLSSVAAMLVLKHHTYFERQAEKIRKRKDLLYQRLEKIPEIRSAYSHGNYLLLQSPRISDLIKSFENRGISVRTWPDRDYLRLSIGSQADMKKVNQAIDLFLEEVRNEKAL